jgi:Terpene cyclase DEP1
MSRKSVYLLLCVLGIAIPYSQFLPWLFQNGFDWRLFLASLAVNRISLFFVADVLVSAVVLVVFMGRESERARIRHGWIATVGLCLVGVSFALPVYLYLRERELESARTA